MAAAALAVALAVGAPAGAGTGVTERVGDGMRPSVSADGRFVAFAVYEPVRQTSDLFVYDRTSGSTELASVSSTGERGNNFSSVERSSLSADGRSVAFDSHASNLVVGDTNNQPDVFVRDRTAGTTERVSVRASGLQSAGASVDPAISADGRFVAFVSSGRLVAADKSSAADVYLRDRQTGRLERVSVGAGGAEPNGPSDWPSVSADGRFVAFASDASNLVPGDTNNARDVFVRDRLLGTSERVSFSSAGAQAAGANDLPQLSADGRVVAFSSADSSLVAGDTNGALDVFVRDLETGTTVRASADTLGLDMSGVGFAPAISGDGRSVAFIAHPVGDPFRRQVFVYDRLTGATELASVAKTGAPGGNDSEGPAISGDGGLIAFWSAAWNLVEGGHGGIFLRERVDRQPPTLSVPGPLTLEGAAAGGARVSYSVSATDAGDPNPTVSCSPVSGSLFRLGMTTVTCTATDASGNSASASFTVTVTSAALPGTFPVSASCKAAWGTLAYSNATAVALSPSDAWTVGLTSGQVGHWDGSVLAAAPALIARPAAVAARTASDVWIVGRDGSAHFDGSGWSVVPIAPVAGATRIELAAVAALAPDDVWAAGTSLSGPSASLSSPVLEHWDGATWSVLPNPSPASLGRSQGELFAVRALAANDVWAAGRADEHTLVEHWDGTRWSVVASPDGASAPSELRALAALTADDIWAVGRSGGSPSQPLVEHWDGTGWSVVPAPSPRSGQDPLLTGVAAVSATDVWASGSYASPAGLRSPRLFLEHWDGAGWSLVDTGATTVRFHGGIDALPNGIVLAAGTNVQQLCEARVLDAGVAPQKTSGIGFGTTVAWSIDAAATSVHSVTDASGLGLFDSGPRRPGGSFTYTFAAAGTYKLSDSANGHVSTVSVALTAKPTSGTAATAFSLAWASTGAPSSFIYDVQVKRPGSTVYVDYLAGTADPSAAFTPDAGVGTYAFRARIRNTGNGASSGWSATKTITAL